jgi:outer membrane protein assembly factor BamB
MKNNSIIVCVIVTLWFTMSEASNNWPQWRGANRDGMIQGGTFPQTWPEKLTKQWQISIGSGHSSPVVINDKIYIFTREQEEEVARAIDMASGKVLWRTSYQAPYEVYPGAAAHGSGPRSTPAIWKDSIFTFGISGILSAFDTNSGKLKWQKNFQGKFPESAPPFGASMSPLVEDGVLIAHVGGHEGGAIIAFDPENGNEKWTLNEQGPGYASPILINVQGSKQIVTQAHRKVMGIDFETGKLLWSVPFVTPCDQNIVTPLVAGNLLVFSSLDTGTFALKLKKQDGIWTPEQAWQNDAVSMYMSTPVYVDGKIIGLSHKKQGQFYAVDASSGSVLWASAPKIAENAALIADGKSVLILKNDGQIDVLSSDSKTFAPFKTYKVSNSETWAHPVPIDSGLLIKDGNTLTLWRYHSGSEIIAGETIRVIKDSSAKADH